MKSLRQGKPEDRSRRNQFAQLGAVFDLSKPQCWAFPGLCSISLSGKLLLFAVVQSGRDNAKLQPSGGCKPCPWPRPSQWLSRSLPPSGSSLCSTALQLRGTSAGWKSCAGSEEGLWARLLLLGTFCSTCGWVGLQKDRDFYRRLLAFPYLRALLSMTNCYWRRTCRKSFSL